MTLYGTGLMPALRSVFSPHGVIGPGAFVSCVIALYLAGLASQWLTTPDVMSRGGIWPVAAAQALLIWVWFALHARRLRDAGRPTGIAVGVSVLYALSIVLLVIVAAAFFGSSAADATGTSVSSALGVILLVSIVAILSGSPHYDFGSIIVATVTALAFVPLVLALAISVWAATRPSVQERAT
jgi:hypothetical protein